MGARGAAGSKAGVDRLGGLLGDDRCLSIGLRVSVHPFLVLSERPLLGLTVLTGVATWWSVVNLAVHNGGMLCDSR